MHGEVDAACQLLSQARQSPGGWVGRDVYARAYALQTYVRWDKPARAIGSLERAIEAAPWRADLRRLHGALLRRSGANKQAVAELAEARRLAPEDPQIAYEALLTRLAAGQGDGELRDLAAGLQGQAARRASVLLAALEGDLPSAERAVADSQHPLDRLIHAVLLLGRGQVVEALPSLEMAAAQEQLPRAARAYANLYLGIALARRGQSGTAAEALEMARALGAPDSQVQAPLAWAYQQLAIEAVLSGDLAAAVNWFKRLADLGGPEAATARDNAAYALSLWGQERARQGDYEGAVSAWSQALAINPQDLVVRQNLAVALERAGRSEEAIPHWHELVRQMPREVGGAARRKGEAEEDSLRNHVRAVAHRHLADLYLDQEEVERAIDQLEKAVKAVPGDLDTRRSLARLLVEEGRPKKAVPHLERVVAEAPESVADHLELGMALVDSGAEQKGIEYLERALELQPDEPAARYALGGELVRRASRDPRAGTALQDAQRAVELLPPQYVGLAWIALGGAQLVRGNRSEAEKSFKRAIKEAPSKAIAAVRVGSAYWEAGDREAAIAAWTDAMKRAKRSPSAYAELAAVWAVAGDADRCRECLQASMERDYVLEAVEAVMRVSESRKLQPLLRQVLQQMVGSAKRLVDKVLLARMLVYAGDMRAASSVLSRAAVEAVETNADMLVVHVILDMDLRFRLLDRKAALAMRDWLDEQGYFDDYR